jgi:peroxiredoxin
MYYVSRGIFLRQSWQAEEKRAPVIGLKRPFAGREVAGCYWIVGGDFFRDGDDKMIRSLLGSRVFGFGVIFGMTLCCWSVGMALGVPDTVDLAAASYDAPVSPPAKQYLGLTEGRSFALSDIDAKFLLIGNYGVECPYCHSQAPVSAKLYEMIEQNPEMSKDIKLIGVMTGGNAQQTEAYASTFRLPYPLLADPFFTLHRMLDKPRVPLTLLIRKDGKVLWTYQGVMDDLEGIVLKIKKACKGS